MIMAWPFSSSVGADPHAYSSQVGSLPSSKSVARRLTESMWRDSRGDQLASSGGQEKRDLFHFWNEH